MLKFESSPLNLTKPELKFHASRAALAIFWAIIVSLTLISSASAQDFSLQNAPFSPDAVAPGGTSSSTITVGALNGFTGTVDLSCQVSSNQATTSTPVCSVSPAAGTPT